MNPAIYIAILLPLFMAILFQSQSKKSIIKQRIITNKLKKEKNEMIELAKRFIGKECLIYTFNSQLEGTVKEVSKGAILLESRNTVEIVNLDFIVRIREYPRGKKGKKKSVVLD